MASTLAAVAPARALEDPLAHLPCSTQLEFRKGQTIYNHDVVDIYQPNEFFGESALLSLPRRAEQASAMADAKLMLWTTAEIEDIVLRRPRLAVALLQVLVQRTVDFTHRIESFSCDNIARRLARSLIRFADRQGTCDTEGAMHMAPLTHELLSQYVGTSREIVTHYMNQFRKQGYLRYSRKGIVLYRDALQDWLTEAV
jgi:CRP-like cAMP-binding protein